MKPNPTSCMNAFGTIAIDRFGTILAFSVDSERIFGYLESEVAGKNFVILMPEPDRQLQDGSLAPYLREGSPNLIGQGRDVEGRRKDGSTFSIHFSVVATEVAGEEIFIGVVSDMSESQDNEIIQARFSAIIESSTDAIMSKTLDGIVTSWNPAAERMFGYRADEMIGKSMALLIPPGREDEEPQILAKIGRGEQIDHFETVRKRKNGETFPISVTISPIRNAKGIIVGASKIARDITEKNSYEEEIVRHRDHLQELVSMATAEVTAIVQTAVSGIVTIDNKGIVHIFNPSAEKLFGWTRDEVVGKNISLLMEEPYASHHDGYLSKFLDTRKASIIGIGREVTAKRKDGSTFPAHLAVGHTELSDSRHFFVGFVSDITLQKKNEADLRQAKDDAEAGAKAKSAFVANMSHEIRTPMNAVIGFSEVALQDPALSPETSKYVKIILTSAKSLMGIINDVLDASKLESGKLSLETICFNLPNALADTLRTLESRAEEKGLLLNLEYAAALPVRFMGDPHRLRQVILNLVGNAIKFTEEGSVTLAVGQGDKQDFLNFSIKDSGIGMTPEQSAKVFEAFSQADSSTTRRFGGTGLGTTISKQIVELMSGNIWVESVVGQGSIFHFSARFSEATETKNCLYEDGNIVEEGYISPRLFRILLAEDIEANATLVMLRFKQQGHDVDWVKNGFEAVEAFQQGGYELILMDVMMPELDGLSASREIRRLEAGTGRRIPILALTASIMREDNEKCIAAGMDRVEGKPIDFDHLFTTIEHVVSTGVRRPNAIRKIAINATGTLDFSTLEGVADYKKALKTWVDPVAYVKVLFAFSAQRSNDAEVMGQLLSKNQSENESARAVAHALKGLAGNLAINQVANWASVIDADLKSGNRNGAIAKLDDLRQSLVDATAAIARLHRPVDDFPEIMKAFDAEVVREILRELSFALDELNPDVVEPALTRLAAFVVKADMAPIQRCVEAFDFDIAKEKVLALAEKLGVTIR